MHPIASFAIEMMSNNFRDDLTQPFTESDFTLLVEEKRLYFNRAVLTMHSPHFRRLLLTGEENAESAKEIKLVDKHFDDIHTLLKLLLNYAHDSRLITDDNVETLLELAQEYQLACVKALIETYLLLNWKLDEAKIVGAFKLAAKFGLHFALRNLLKKPAENYPPLLTDENVEQILAVAKEYDVANVLGICERYLLENWKTKADKIVRAVELSAKFGLEKALANLLRNGQFERCNVSDDNVEQLLELCKRYLLPDIKSDCEQFILESWRTKGEKALRAVEIGYQMNLPYLTKTFVPLAACRPLEEIDAAMPNLSTELYCAILHGSYVRIREGTNAATNRIYPSNGISYLCVHGADHYNWYCNRGCDGRWFDERNVIFELPKHSCGKPRLGFGLAAQVGTMSDNFVGQVCTCPETAPNDAVMDDILNRVCR